MAIERVAVLGAGSWGTTFAKVIADSGPDVVLWARRQDVASAITETRVNAERLPGISLPANLTATADPAKALDGADAVVLADGLSCRVQLDDLAGVPAMHLAELLASRLQA